MSEGYSNTQINYDSVTEHRVDNKTNLTQWAALLCAFLACFSTILSYQSGNKESTAILLKNEIIVKTAQASNAWAFYQAKKARIHLMTIAIETATDSSRIAHFKKELARYQAEATPIRMRAQALDKAVAAANQSANELEPSLKKFSQSMVLLQISISLASIAALVRKYWLLLLSLVSTLIAGSLAFLGLIQ